MRLRMPHIRLVAKVLAILVLLSYGGAVLHADPGTCIKINNDLDRLTCYDQEHGRTPKKEPIATPAGKWEILQETSKITDQKTIVLSLPSDDLVNCRWNRGERISLVIRCLESKTVLYFATNCHMTSSEYNNYGNITYRLDSAPAETVSGDASTDNKALGLWRGGSAIPMIKKMFGKSMMIVRMMPYGESPFTASFQISGLEQAIRPLRESCKW